MNTRRFMILSSMLVLFSSLNGYATDSVPVPQGQQPKVEQVKEQAKPEGKVEKKAARRKSHKKGTSTPVAPKAEEKKDSAPTPQ